MKRFFMMTAALVAAACSDSSESGLDVAPTKGAAVTDGSSTSPGAFDATARIAALKDGILTIATANYGSRDNVDGVAASLQPLVEELDGLVPNVDPAATLDVLKGAWLQVWTNDINPGGPSGGPGPKLDDKQTYQVISDKGYFYNLADLSFGPSSFTGVLRGKYESNGEALAIEFTRYGIKQGALDKDRSLVDLTEAIESGADPVSDPPGAGRGPVGQKGVLRNVFVDDTVRISVGANVRDGVSRLYVLRRVEKPAK